MALTKTIYTTTRDAGGGAGAGRARAAALFGALPTVTVRPAESPTIDLDGNVGRAAVTHDTSGIRRRDRRVNPRVRKGLPIAGAFCPCSGAVDFYSDAEREEWDAYHSLCDVTA